jgi:hypothetical protein
MQTYLTVNHQLIMQLNLLVHLMQHSLQLELLLDSSDYTAGDVLTKVTVDGSGSGLGGEL